MLTFHSASTGVVNSKRAIAECLENALEGENGLHCDLIIFYTSIGHNFRDILDEAHRLSPGARIVGCTAAGVIGREGPNESMKALAIVAVKGGEDEFAVAGRDSITSSTSYSVAAELARELKAKNANINMIHFLPSGLDFAADKALEGIEPVIGSEIPIFGGTSCDNMKAVSSFQFMGDKVMERGAVAVGFADPTLEVMTQATHGFNVMGEPFEVTRSELNRILEFEGQPAWKFLTNRVGLPGATNLADLLGVGFLALQLSENLQREYGNSHILFSFFELFEDGSLSSPLCIPAGTNVWMAMRDEERMFGDLDKMISQILERCKGRRPIAVFHADCAARGRLSLNRVMKDEIIHRMQYPLIQDGAVPWLGMYGFGEFSRLGGRNRFHMMTTSLFLILRKEG